jgi:uncharacterized protein
MMAPALMQQSPAAAGQTVALDVAAVHARVQRACERIAPTWPLDQFIAVNPYWGFTDRPFEDTAARLASLSGTPMLMPRSYYREQWRRGAFSRAHLQQAIDAAAAKLTVDQLCALLEAGGDEPVAGDRMALVTDRIDAQRDLGHSMAWRDFVTHHISQCCAAFFDQGQSSWGPQRDAGLYGAWRRQCEVDLSPRLLMGMRGFRERLARLPRDAGAAIVEATRALGLPDDAAEDYYTALLLSINGWASWCAYERWQARLGLPGDAERGDPGDGRLLEQLLAMRIAWEWLLHDDAQSTLTMHAARDVTRLEHEARERQAADWLIVSACERAWQASICGALFAPAPPAAAPHSAVQPAVQAVFCIDVRSEVYRRALEAASPQVQTLGFAGFFGLPISYSPLGTAMTRPQLPGLLAAAVETADVLDRDVIERAGGESDPVARESSLMAQLALRRRSALDWRGQWQRFRTAASSGFSFVESCGVLYAGTLLQRSLPREGTVEPVEASALPEGYRRSLRPRLKPAGASAQALQAQVDLAAGVLGAMGLTQDFARLVLLAGHGSQTDNNPHAAGLDCGACGGQTGEVNARALAALLNDAPVRAGLIDRGIAVPATTWFLGGMHNTTTDEMHLFDLDLLPDTHDGDLEQLRQWCRDAGERARAERAAALGLSELVAEPAALEQAVRTRANDWAQVRPEWGLADNAAFIVAPRATIRHMNLAGRSFLHDYVWQRDAGFGTLELIMTAPMIVTHWINMQYYASTVDNRRYGSGNKVLHNVVGGRLGVFEGNGGDLRIGLPMQSLHDGEQWRHTPLRLSVFIAAPQAAIDAVIAKHELVKRLLDNRWLHLFRIDLDTRQVARYRQGSWESAGGD